MKRLSLFAGMLMLSALAAQSTTSSHFENAEDFPLMGNWQGKLIRSNAKQSANQLAAQLICIDEETYKLRVLPQLHRRAAPYLEEVVKVNKGKISYRSQDWALDFDHNGCRGHRKIKGEMIPIELKKVEITSPTLNQPPPKEAIVLFNGSDLEKWKHPDSRKPTWKLLEDGSTETVSEHWNNKQNRKLGIGGSLATRREFKSMHLHMEFRYPVEIGKKGQKKGNSGVFISGFKEIQILNSYGLTGYWNECGALYRTLPPKVNAAAPPLQWQTYDIEVLLPKKGETTGEMTVLHNGMIIHNQVQMKVGNRNSVSIKLQDHSHPIQFRNIWIMEKDEMQRL